MNKIEIDPSFYGAIHLDIGCGPESKWRIKNKRRIGMDITDFGQDIVWDATRGIPLPDNSVAYIEAAHFFEHFTEEEFIALMNECHRVLKEGHELYMIMPSAERAESWIPCHKLHPKKITIEWFDSSNDENYKTGEIDRLPWDVKEIVINSKKDLHAKLCPIKN